MFSVSRGGVLTEVGVTFTPSPSSVAFSSTGDLLASASPAARTISLFAISHDGRLSPLGEVRTYSEVRSVAFHPHDPALLAAANGADGAISVFDVSGGGGAAALVEQTQPRPGDPAAGVAFSPDGELLVTAGAISGDVSLFEVQPGGNLIPLGSRSTEQRISALAFGPDGEQIAMADPDRDRIAVIRTWREGSPGQQPLPPLVGLTHGSPQSIAVSADGLIATANLDPDSVSTFADLRRGATGIVGLTTPTGRDPAAVAFSPSGEFVATANYGDGSVSVYAVAEDGTLTPVGSPTDVAVNPSAVAFDPRGFLAATSNVANAIAMFEMSDAGWLTPREERTAGAYPTAVAMKGDVVAVANKHDSTVATFRSHDGFLEPIGKPAATGVNPVSLTFSAHADRLAAANVAGQSISMFLVSDTGELTPADPRDTPTGGSVAVAFSSSADRLANADGTDTVSIYDVSADGALTEVGSTTAGGSEPSALAFNPAGDRLAVAQTGAHRLVVYRVDHAGALEPAGFADTEAGPVGVAFSPARSLVATVNADSTLSLFHMSSADRVEEIGSPTPTGEEPSAVAFSPDGRFLAVANEGEHSLSIFALEAAKLESSIVAGPPPITRATQATFAFEANYPATFRCSVDASEPVRCAGSYTTGTLADGEHTFEVIASDPLGRDEDTPARDTWTIDTTGPAPVEPNDRWTIPVVAELPMLTWPVTSDALSEVERYELWIDDALSRTVSALTCKPSGCSAVPAQPLTAGKHTWWVRAVDRLGNSSAGTVATIHVDATAPAAFDLLQPADRAVFAARRPQLSWHATTDDRAGVARYDVVIDERVVASAGAAHTAFVPPADLGEGEHRWRVVAVDGFGHERSSPTRRFTVDTTPPTAVLRGSPQRFVAPLTVRLDAGESYDPGGGRIVAWQFDVDGDGTFETAADRPYADHRYVDAGAHTVGVRVVDEAGHAATATTTIDGEQPLAPPGSAFVTIDRRAEFTRDLAVDLRIGAPFWLGAASMIVSNDGQPDEARQRPIGAHVTGWKLAPGDGYRDRRIVYVFFYNAAGVQVADVQDDIRYDPVPPRLLGATLRRISATRAILSLRARDDASGLGRLEVRRGGKLVTRRTRYASRLKIPLSRTSRAVRVMIYDRAGNRTARRVHAPPRSTGVTGRALG